ncbi:MAG: hypothetical protein E8D52_05640 [Nitrospira sp.]|nr:MAG: hypothetical protein E8D52_05640 [Nitrospira sp.]
MGTRRAHRLSLVFYMAIFLSCEGDLFAEKLPGLSIDQFWDKSPETTDDYRKEGFVAGYSRPNSKPERSVVLSKDRADAFIDGWKQGQKANMSLSAQFRKQFETLPTIEPGIRGERYDELERQYREQLEAIFHKHMPHTEVEETARIPIVVPGRGVR